MFTNTSQDMALPVWCYIGSDMPGLVIRRSRMRGASGLLLLAGLTSALVFARSSRKLLSVVDAATLAHEPAPPPANAYAGDAACSTCHAKITATYETTAHHLTSKLPDTNIEGSFDAPNNLMRTSNPRLVFEMNAQAGGVFTETARYQKLSGEMQELTLPMDLIIGSGRKGHTYLYWNGDQLFELPVSYWTKTQGWINSPGYQDGLARFDRVIPPQCLECHASYFESAQPPVNRYVKSSLVLGVFCEKCHGPGAEHVRRERSAHPPSRGSSDEAIVNPAQLPRDRQIDTCSLCHSGPIAPLAPSLSFLPGDRLADYVKTEDLDPKAPIDVHTNQVQLLEQSRCFRSSNMTCSTCHNVHTPQRAVAAFADRCLTCHRVQACPKFTVLKAAIRTRCVDCHMPVQSSATLFADQDGHRLNPEIRNHRIAIYPEIGAGTTSHGMGAQ